MLMRQQPKKWFGFLGTLCCAAGLSVGHALADDTIFPAKESSPAKTQQVAVEHRNDASVIQAIETQLTDPKDVFQPTALHLQQPQPRIQFDEAPQTTAAAQRLSTRLFGKSGRGRSLLSANRRRFAGQPGTAIVLGSESRLRLSTDAGDLLKKSPSALGVGGQRRSPINDWFTTFANMNYTEGRDHSRFQTQSPIAIGSFGPGFRSGSGAQEEPLFGIAPLETRIGIRMNEPDQRYGVELSTRIVDNQDRIALSLAEQKTAGYTTFDVRAFLRPSDNVMIIAGI
jgi:hypothetical protein